LSTAASQIATQESTQLVSAQAQQTVNNFCDSVSTQDYTSAYSNLSSSLQQQYSQAQFTQDNQNHDRTLGKVTTCTPQGVPSVNGSSASITVMVTRTLAPTPNSSGTAAPTETASATGQITLIQDSSGNWVITGIDSSLNML
jgi:limonene-1,2-epoxide hydrolase